MKNEGILTDTFELFRNNNAADFDEVNIILSASRGGSTFVFETLAKHSKFASPDGEHGKWYRKHNLGYRRFGSDRVPSSFSEYERDKLLSDILSDVGVYVDEEHPVYDFEKNIMRLSLQFPNEAFDMGKPGEAVSYDKMKNVWKEEGQSWKAVLNKLDLKPQLYDAFADDDIEEEYTEWFVEEPPFITSTSGKRALKREDLESKSLLIKTSVDAYRVRWLIDNLFENATVNILHLTRNPAASINGLIDGWRLNRGFQTYHIDTDHVRDYDNEMWCYDVPPDRKAAQLPTICGKQWAGAHEHILEGITEDDNYHRMKFEDFIRHPFSAFSEALNHFGVEPDTQVDSYIRKDEKVMSTKEPQKARWRERKPVIYSTINKMSNRLEELIEEFDYEKEDKWI